MPARYFEGAAHAALYAKFRPVTPVSLTSSIIKFLKEKLPDPLHSAADVGCGSGQSTKVLSQHFLNVTGLDASEAQIREASKQNEIGNVLFKLSAAEDLPIENESVQLVTAGQACHWFDLPKFYKEVDRILAPNGVLALYGYNLPRPSWCSKDRKIDLHTLLDTIYTKDTKGLWGKERKFVDNSYTDEEFVIPYAERRRDEFVYETKASVRDVQGYVSTWSGFQKYKSIHGDSAGQKLLDEFVENVMERIGRHTSAEETELTLQFPFFLLMARKPV